jgi:hypothetical protein
LEASKSLMVLLAQDCEQKGGWSGFEYGRDALPTVSWWCDSETPGLLVENGDGAVG